MVNLLVQRKFSNILSNLSDDLVQEFLSDYEFDDTVQVNKRFDHIAKKVDLSDKSNFKKVWQIVELAHLSNSWLDLFTTKSKIFSLKDLKSKFSQEKFNSSNLTILILNRSPKIFGIFYFMESKRALDGRASISNHLRECVYYIPKYSILLTDIHSDNIGKEFKKDIESIFSDLTPFRTKTMVMSKFYNDTRMIHDLHVKSDHQVAGFSGMDSIAFHGDDIKQGLYGLHKRQDIRVHLDQIGPRIEVSGINLHFKIGPKIRVKSPKGFEELIQLIEEFH